MSEIRVTDIKGENGLDAVNFTKGINTTGIITATSFSGSGANLTGIAASPNLGATETQGYQNLKILNTANNSTVITCDSVLLENSSGTLIKVSTVNVTLNATTTGANGLDTGSLAQGKFYYIYIINNGSTTASLASLSSTSPTLPSGYTYKARVGGVSTNANAGGANIIPSVQVNNNHMFAEVQTNDKVRVTNGSGAQSATQSALPMVSALASSWTAFIKTSGATSAGTTHRFQIQGSASAYEQIWQRYHVTGNGIGDMNFRIPFVPIITVSSGVPQTWVATNTNTGPNWSVYCIGFNYG